jgi:hypothetical protein
MKKTFTIIFVMLLVLACEKSTNKPQQTKIEPVQAAEERRGGNGGGGNNPNSPNYNPCAWTAEYTNETAPVENWGITVDTTTCGYVILRWPPQPKFTPVDSCTIAGRYLVATATISGPTTGSPCAGNYTFTNAYYYLLGSGCSMWPGGEYRILLSYLERDTINKVLRWHYSEPVQFKAGTRSIFLGTCQ